MSTNPRVLGPALRAAYGTGDFVLESSASRALPVPTAGGQRRFSEAAIFPWKNLHPLCTTLPVFVADCSQRGSPHFWGRTATRKVLKSAAPQREIEVCSTAPGEAGRVARLSFPGHAAAGLRSMRDSVAPGRLGQGREHFSMEKSACLRICPARTMLQRLAAADQFGMRARPLAT